MSCWSSKNILPPLLAESIMNNECMHEHWETIESDRERIKRKFSFYEQKKKPSFGVQMGDYCLGQLTARENELITDCSTSMLFLPTFS